jgi:light-regulated signal transduction histidine kinase (bacteriophytochrome)
MFSDDVYNNPEDYLQEQGKDFSQEQKKFYDSHKLESNALLKRILKLSEGLKNEPEGEREDQMRELIKKLEDKYFGLIEKMDEIEAEPEGEYKEDAIQEKIDELVESVEENLMKYIEDYGLEINNFLDGEEIIRLVIQSDGYQVMSSHDGELNEEYVDGETFYIIRID